MADATDFRFAPDVDVDPGAQARRFLLILAAVALALTALGLAGADRALAEALRARGWESAAFFHDGTALTDRALILLLPKYVFGAVVAGLGAAVALLRRRLGLALLAAGVVQDAAVFAATLIKGEFGRLRPYQLLESGGWDHDWFVAGGSSFPSGHNAWYWGLLLPLAVAYPRWRWPLLALPLFIAAARIVEAMHFLSDVTAAIVLAAVLCLPATPLLRRLA